MNEKIKIRFLGAAQTVTGSKYLVSTGNKNILVDCGLFQGEKKLRLLNREPFPLPPGAIDLVLLTHAHLDHTGYLPRLVSEGYNGEIWGTAPTIDLTKIILSDSARIQEEDAEKANEEGSSRHHPAVPLYTEKDVRKTTPLFVAQPLGKWIAIDENISCNFHYNGHILGATFIELRIGKKIIVFSGDIGRKKDPLLFPPDLPEKADVLLIESTYGDRIHPGETSTQLAAVINQAFKRGSTVLIPSFAVERSQVLVYLACLLRKQRLIPSVPIYMDSPMGSSAMEVFTRYPAWHKLTADDCAMIEKEITVTRSLDDTHRIAQSPDAKIIIAGSGMVTGGRVLTYLAHYVGDPTATVLLAGYQAPGTRGRALVEGASEIKMFGKYFPVKARIENLEGISSHADQEELMGWIKKLKEPPQKIFVVHGEKKSAEALVERIDYEYGYTCEIPGLNAAYDL